MMYLETVAMAGAVSVFFFSPCLPNHEVFVGKTTPRPIYKVSSIFCSFSALLQGTGARD